MYLTPDMRLGSQDAANKFAKEYRDFVIETFSAEPTEMKRESFEGILMMYELAKRLNDHPEKFLYDGDLFKAHEPLKYYSTFIKSLVELTDEFEEPVHKIIMVRRASGAVQAHLRRLIIPQGKVYYNDKILRLLKKLIKHRSTIEENTEIMRNSGIDFRAITDRIMYDVDLLAYNAGLCFVLDGRLDELGKMIAGDLMSDFCKANGLHPVFPISLEEGKKGNEEWSANFFKWGKDTYGQKRWEFVENFIKYIEEIGEQ